MSGVVFYACGVGINAMALGMNLILDQRGWIAVNILGSIGCMFGVIWKADEHSDKAVEEYVLRNRGFRR